VLQIPNTVTPTSVSGSYSTYTLTGNVSYAFWGSGTIAF
jgi:hypothetical protein